MLIKLQRSRNCVDYIIIENARNVVYSDRPVILYTPKAVDDHVKHFIESGKSQKVHALYEKASESTDLKKGFQLNRVAFDNEDDTSEDIIFDGEAYICNDDGKTIHRVRRGGPMGYAPVTPRKD